MQSSFCKYENKENCELLKKACVPGQKGCIINSKIKIKNSKLDQNSPGYKSGDIARFKK